MSEHTLTILLVPDCPHAAPAVHLARHALASAGVEAAVETLEVDDQAQADRLRFVGSPSFHLDGKDLFPTSSPPAIACRVYPTPSGLRGVPTVDGLTRAIEAGVGN
ncbi:hypothetical protein ACFVQ3_03665 [Oerskovia sp. NPDC057915]|uniref:hypothetical protein n=1 Tax=Oerskovia sp. NPDC057915 TaxID=3346280 RepID=UPI0036DEC135